VKPCLIPFAALAITGCATYTPKPLDTDAAVLAPPVAAALSRDTTAIDRPYLTPASIDLSQPLDPNAIATLAVIANPDL
jgi:hypothetical protein